MSGFISYIIAVSVILFLLNGVNAFAQNLETVRYEREKLIGVNFNTSAGFLGGIMGQVTFKARNMAYQYIGIELVNVKHNQEIRVTSYSTGNSFILGKQNYLFSIRPRYGYQWVLFTPAREDGVQVNANIAVGPTIGIIKPYYIRFDHSRSGDLSRVKEEPFDPEKHRDANKITGHGSFFRGFEKSGLAAGIHMKASVMFYLGNYGKRVSGLEAGGLLEAYFHSGSNGFGPNRITIIPYTKNQWLYTSLFLNIYFGWRK